MARGVLHPWGGPVFVFFLVQLDRLEGALVLLWADTQDDSTCRDLDRLARFVELVSRHHLVHDERDPLRLQDQRPDPGVPSIEHRADEGSLGFVRLRLFFRLS